MKRTLVLCTLLAALGCSADGPPQDAGPDEELCGDLVPTVAVGVDNEAERYATPCSTDSDCLEYSPRLRCDSATWELCNVSVSRQRQADFDDAVESLATELCDACGEDFPSIIEDCFDREPDGRAWCIDGACATNAPEAPE